MVSCKQFVASFDPRLNRYKWLHQQYHTEHKSIDEIARIIGCSPKTAEKKLRKKEVLGADKIINLYTGRFHMSKHRIMRLLKNKYLGKITQSIDDVYPNIVSRNPLILKEIFEEMLLLDHDTQGSSGVALGMSRKETYALAGRFGLSLYDCDSQYEERFDWFLREVIRRRDEFLFDEFCEPENWYPNRKQDIFTKHFFMKRAKPWEQVFFVDASEVLKKE